MCHPSVLIMAALVLGTMRLHAVLLAIACVPSVPVPIPTGPHLTGRHFPRRRTAEISLRVTVRLVDGLILGYD
jgi:hypothetical protein